MKMKNKKKMKGGIFCTKKVYSKFEKRNENIEEKKSNECFWASINLIFRKNAFNFFFLSEENNFFFGNIH